MAAGGIRVRGLNQVVRALKDVGVPAKEIAEAGYDAGQLVANDARTLVPVKSGALKGSIRVAKLQRKIAVRAGSSRVPYANVIHWGWIRKGIKPNRFFVKALNLNIDNIYKKYFKNLEALIKKYGGK